MPDIRVATAAGRVQKLQEIEPGVYAPVFAAAYGGAGVISDNTGQYRFDVNSLASKMTYDSEGNQTSIMYGPDLNGRRIMQTSTWGPNNLLMHDSDWQLVDANGVAVNAQGVAL